jgi:LPS O-antigen subunit length determinant protein (WzzB/FepE family)
MRLAMQIGPASTSPPHGSFRFSFTDENPERAQRILRELIAQVANTARETPGTNLETVDAPNLPTLPASPSRPASIALGIAMGSIIGVAFIAATSIFRSRATLPTKIP